MVVFVQVAVSIALVIGAYAVWRLWGLYQDAKALCAEASAQVTRLQRVTEEYERATTCLVAHNRDLAILSCGRETTWQ